MTTISKLARTDRPHRPLLGVSGVVLFVCLFLPAIHPCSHDETPLEYPFAWAPYFYGLALAVCAVIGPRLVRLAAHVLRVTTVLFFAGALVLFSFAPGVGSVELTVAGVLWWTLGSGVRERRLAAMTITFAVMSTAWFLFWMVMGGTLWGLWLSFAASIAIGFAGARWFHEIGEVPDEPRVPVAVARTAISGEVVGAFRSRDT